MSVSECLAFIIVYLTDVRFCLFLWADWPCCGHWRRWFWGAGGEESGDAGVIEDKVGRLGLLLLREVLQQGGAGGPQVFPALHQVRHPLHEN